MRTSQIGIDLIKYFEGFISKPYLCPANVPTIGYGSTMYADGSKVKLTDKSITKDEAEELLRETLKDYENIVSRKIKVEIKQNQFDALVSHVYNTGGSNTIFKMVNENTNDMVLKIWWENHYIMGGGQKLKGLIARRKAETKIYFIS